MRLTSILMKTALGHQYKCHWVISSKRRIIPTLAEQTLKAKNVEIHDPNDILRPSLQEE